MSTQWLESSRLWLRKTVSGMGKLVARQRQLGQGLVEYALILVLIAIVVIGVLSLVGARTSQVFDEIRCTLDGGPTHTDNGNGNSNKCK